MRVHHPSYAILALAVFATEVAIAAFVDDELVRPYVGDSLAVVLVYLALRAVTRLRPMAAVLLAFGTAVAIELGQLFGLIGALGLKNDPLARFVLGAGFDLKDFAAYAAGALFVLVVETVRAARRSARPPARA